ncbi:hypothetical protein MY3957_008816 [Beauveria namnaoensis]
MAELFAMATPTSRRSWNLSMCTFIIDSVGRWTFAAWLIPIFLTSFGESVPVIFIRVWILAAPKTWPILQDTWALRFFYFMFHAILQVAIIESGTTHMLAVLPAIGVVAGLLLYYFLQSSRQVRSIQLAAKTPLYKHSDETASGLRHIRAMGLQSGNFLVGLAIWMFLRRLCIIPTA